MKQVVKIQDKSIELEIIQDIDSSYEPDVDIIMPSYQDRSMANIAARSFFHFEKKLNIRIIFVDPSGDNTKFDTGDYNNKITSISAPDIKFNFTDECGKMSHSNAYALEIGALFCKSPYVFVCHNDVLAYSENWLSYLHSKMNNYKLAAFLKDNIRIGAAHVSGFMYDRTFYQNKNVHFWPKQKPLMDVGDEFSYYLQQQNMKYFVCPCSHNDPSLLKSICKKNPELCDISGDKCLDENGKVVYIHIGRGTVKMMGHYKKKNKTNYKEWIKFTKRHIDAHSI